MVNRSKTKNKTRFKFLAELNNQVGLTLIEIIISITLLSFVMISVINATSSSSVTKDTTLKINKNNLMITAFFDRIEWDFQHLYSPLFYSHKYDPKYSSSAGNQNFDNNNQQFLSRYQGNRNFSGPNDTAIPIPIIKGEQKGELEFFTQSNRRKIIDSKEGTYAWVKYYLTKDIDTKDERLSEDKIKEGSVLKRTIVNSNLYDVDEIEFEKFKGQILLFNVTSLIFYFWDNEKKKFVESIREVKDGSSILRGIKVEVKFIDEFNIEQTHSRIIRPLFPEFTPEDPKDLLKPANNPNDEEFGA